MNQKPNLWQRAVEFVTGKGFYLAVLVCVMAIGLSAYFLIQGVRSTMPQLADKAASETVAEYSWPVSGTVISTFSVEALSYNDTMGDWRTHDGVDIASSLGTRVQATAKGVVSQVYDDEVMGVTVVVDHGNELYSVYSNLAENPPVKVGDAVASDTVVGEIGDTAVAESGKEPHLHFAMYEGNDAVNPEEYLGQ